MKKRQSHPLVIEPTQPPPSRGDYRVIFPNTAKQHHQHRCYHSQSASFQSAPEAPNHLPHLIRPHSSIARAVLMGNAISEVGGVDAAPTGTTTTRKEAITHPYTVQPEQTNGMTHSHSHQHSNTHHHQHQHYLNQRQNEYESHLQPKSNLSALLEDQSHRNESLLPTEPAAAAAVVEPTPCAVCEHQQQTETSLNTTTLSSSSSKHDEADLASGPPPPSPPVTLLGHSAPSFFTATLQSNRRRFAGPLMAGTPPSGLQKCTCTPAAVAGPPHSHQRRVSSSDIVATKEGERVRRCLSSKELGTLAPLSGSPYVDMLNQREVLESQMTERFREKRDCHVLETTPSTSPAEAAPIQNDRIIATDKDVSSSSSLSQKSASRTTNKKTGANQDRNRRRAAHNRAVVEDLCEIVAELFLAESKLINPTTYGVSRSLERGQVLKSVQKFVAALPTRYALGVDTPSEVLLHMRLMAVARSDPAKCVVHIINLDNDCYWTDNATLGGGHQQRNNLRLVTIACADVTGLLEYVTKILGTGGSRVLDADVMLSSDRIVLDRFVVEMSGRLRLDKLAHFVENFLKKAKEKAEHDREHKDDCSCQDSSKGVSSVDASGTLYYNLKHHSSKNLVSRRDLREEMQTAVPLTEVLASPNQNEAMLDPNYESLKRHFSVPTELACRSLRGQHSSTNNIYTPSLNNSHHSQAIVIPKEPCSVHLQPRPDHQTSTAACVTHIPSDISLDASTGPSMRQKRPLVNRRAASDLDRVGIEGESVGIDFVTVRSKDAGGALVAPRVIPLIPFDELMLIETIGTGRVSTIYRAVWQNPMGVQMVALKVAMVNPETRDMSHVDELRREADIAARLKHPNVCDLVGVAADAECFCLAYDFCEGGSVLSLLLDTSRYYEYLPIALDVANGMAYLHSRDVIHRDLKPSNILLSRDHRAKIADFGMSVANAGQELTAETGTYRYMAPEVIRHESYSSNADVYSFGVFLWQLITRQVPFASMTPVQAAFAVAEGRRPEIPESTPLRLKEIIESCWNQDSHKRPSFTYIAMALADYVKLSFSPASVGTQTLQIANEMLATVEGNSNINVDFTTPVPDAMYLNYDADVGLEI